jgi:endonuclease/exonuclease/phosphatase family metal-dependent hydrolase
MEPLRALTFNVRYDTSADGDDAWPHRRELVAGVLRYHRPDVVGLQEPLVHQLEYLRESLPGYEFVGVGREDGAEAGEFTPVGVWTDRLAIEASGTRWLSPTPAVPGSRDPDAARPRILTWGRLRDRASGRRFHLLNTHFDHRGAPARRRSADRVRRAVADVAGDGPAVVTGDLNATPGSVPLARLTAPVDERPGRRLGDAFERAPHRHGPTATFERFDGPPDERIDYVLVTDGIDVSQHAVLADRGDDRVPSDHLPVVAELRVGGDGGDAGGGRGA